jgi:hypothetical protein
MSRSRFATCTIGMLAALTAFTTQILGDENGPNQSLSITALRRSCSTPGDVCVTTSHEVESSDQVSFHDQLEAVGDELWTVHSLLSECAANLTPLCRGFAHVVAQHSTEMAGWYACAQPKTKPQFTEAKDAVLQAMKRAGPNQAEGLKDDAQTPGVDVIILPAKYYDVPGISWDSKSKALFRWDKRVENERGRAPVFLLCFQLPESSRSLLEKIGQ